MKEFLKNIAFRYTKLGAPKYEYNVEPEQLAEIISSIVHLGKKKNNLNLLEIGVARGMTTRFIAEHVQRNNLTTKFYCLDTFSSFTTDDLNFETTHREKNLNELRGFGYNDFEVWKQNFSKFEFANAIQCDAGKFNFHKIEGGIDFVFLDVDLYQPTINSLRNMKNHLNNDAIILVDDVADNNSWDGAFEAFFEFVREENVKYEIIGNKCGKIVWNDKNFSTNETSS